MPLLLAPSRFRSKASALLAIFASGKLTGPWTQRAEPLFGDDGGPGMVFTRFDGQLMLVLHQPHKDTERAHVFEIQDTGETLRVLRPLPAPAPAPSSP